MTYDLDPFPRPQPSLTYVPTMLQVPAPQVRLQMRAASQEGISLAIKLSGVRQPDHEKVGFVSRRERTAPRYGRLTRTS